MNKKSWLIALVALVLGGGAAVAITQFVQEDSTVVAAPTAPTHTTEKPEESTTKKKKSTKDEEKQPAEQDVEQTVNAYVEALEQGDTEALCDIQTEALTVKVTASGASGDEITEACAEAAEQLDWAELWAAWASEIDLDHVHVDINGGQANVSLKGGTSLSLDRQKSGEWEVDGVKPSPRDPQVPPTPKAPQSHQVPQSPQIPKAPRFPKAQSTPSCRSCPRDSPLGTPIPGL